jgi:Inosine-uridine preferring nucleoside hydrolase
MQFFGQGKPPVGVVFDTGMGNGIDDVLAMALLYGLDGKNEARVAAIAVSKPNLNAAALCDVIRTFYMLPGSGPFAGFFRGLPVGLADTGKLKEDTPMMTATLAQHPSTNIHKLNDTAEATSVMRNALTAQYDQNALVVATGPLTNLARLLEMHDVKDLIAKKVRLLVVAAGAFPEGPAEFNVKTDVGAARKIFAEWPTPVVASGCEIGNALPFPGESIEKDFAWSPAHPVADAYRAYKAMPYDAPTYALAPVLHAIREKQGYFQVSEPGTISVSPDGRTKFTRAVSGKHRYLILDPEQKERVIKTYVELASAKPVERTFRRRNQNKQEEKK